MLAEPLPDRDQPHALAQPNQLEEQPLPNPRSQKHAKREPSPEAVDDRRGPPRLEHGSRLLEDLPVVHGRRTRGLAGAAIETPIEVLEHRRRRLDLALDEAAHQLQTPSRRVHLDLELPVRWASLEAHAASHAGRKLLEGRGVGVLPARSLQHAILPGFRTWS